MLRKLIGKPGLAALAFGLIAAALVCAIPLAPALAQAVKGDGGTVALSIAEIILTGAASAAVPTILALWALFKAHAAQSEATWDDWVVARVKEVAREVGKESAPAPLIGETIDMRGQLGKGGGT